MGHVTWPRPFQGRFVIRRLGLAMFSPHIKFEMSTITCNEEMKGNAKCKNSRLEPSFGDVRVTHRVHLLLDGKRGVVDFLLVLIECSSLALMAVALLSKIWRNQCFLKGWVPITNSRTCDTDYREPTSIFCLAYWMLMFQCLNDLQLYDLVSDFIFLVQSALTSELLAVGMTLKVTQGHRNCFYTIGHVSLPVSGL